MRRISKVLFIGAVCLFMIACGDIPADMPSIDDAAVPSADTGTPMPNHAWVHVNWIEARPAERGVSRMVYDPDTGGAWLIGGQSLGALPIDDVWHWDGAWQLVTTNDIATRKNHGIAYDRERGHVVVFGGIVGGLAAEPMFRGDTIVGSGSEWRVLDLPTAPSPRSGVAMTYDEARQRVVLFGGLGADNRASDETWEFDGSAWTRLEPAVHPPARFNTEMVYDRARQRTVLFGGMDLDGTTFSDLWAWDGSNWIEITPNGSGPEGRGFFAMAYDVGRDRVVVHGGTTTWPPFITALNTFDDHWEFDGSSWEKIEGEGPGMRSGHHLIYDETKQQLVLFGGVRGGTDLLDDTWVFSTCSASEEVCRGDERMVCGANGWEVAEDCAAEGSVCRYDDSRATACVHSTCSSFIAETTLARFDAEISDKYRVLGIGPEGAGVIDSLSVFHGTSIEPVLTVSDPREVENPPIELRAARGEQLFYGIAGQAYFAARGDRAGEPYAIEFSNLRFLETTERDGQRVFVEGGEEICLERARVSSTVIPFMCIDIDSELMIGATACIDTERRSMRVRCERGMVSSSSRNYGQLVREEDCSASRQMCAMQEDVAMCVAATDGS
jgi:hypothetical protein